MQLKQKLDNLKKLVEAAAPDVEKADNGNKAAGTRVRKAMQAVKEAAHQIRIDCLAHGPTADDVAQDVGKQVGGPGADVQDE